MGTKIELTPERRRAGLFFAPKAQIRLGCDSNVQGGFCVGTAKTDKHITLQCP